MYYLYSGKDKKQLSKCDYSFKNMNEFYEMSKVLTHKITGPYVIQIKGNTYQEVEEFIKNSESYKHLIIYIELQQEVFDYVRARQPNASILNQENIYDVWVELVQRYNLVLAKGCLKNLFFSIKHDYDTMSEIVLELKRAYGDVEVNMDMIKKVVSIDDIVYPRSVLLSYIRMERSRKKKLSLCLANFDKNLVYNSMKKNCAKLLEQKNNYYKTGKGSDLIKTIPYDNLLKMYYAFLTNLKTVHDIELLLKLYEKGEYLNDYIQTETF